MIRYADTNEATDFTFWWWRAAAALFLVTIFCLSHAPQGTIRSDLGTGLGDKVSHAFAYGLLTLLLLQATGRRGTVEASATVLVLPIVVLIGSVDELTQPLFGRICSLADWMANLVGPCLAVFLQWATRRVWRSKR